MEWEAIFIFKCGTKTQAKCVVDWLLGKDWPDELRAQLEAAFGDIVEHASIVPLAQTLGRRVGVWGTNPSHMGMVGAILDYALQTWPNVPSPQGFSYGKAQKPKIDEIADENLNMGQFDGGAVLLRRGAPPEIMVGSLWLKEQLRGAKQE